MFRSTWTMHRKVAHIAVACSLATAPRVARASELNNDAARIEEAWIQASFMVSRLPPSFLASGEAKPIIVPYADDLSRPGCTSVGILGARTTDFIVQLSPDSSSLIKEGATPDEGHQSDAGSAMLVRCGAARSELRNLVVHMKSPQASIEVLVAHGPRPAPSFESLLPERAAGTTAHTGRPGPPPTVAPLDQRIETATRKIIETGGRVLTSDALNVDTHGNAMRRMHLTSGCHRLVAMPRLRFPGRIGISDTDMEIRNPAGEEVLLRDRGYATDALLELCVGGPEMVDVAIGGVPPGGTVTLLHGHWPVPQGIPREWEPRAQASLSRALLHRRGPTLSEQPVWEGLGVGGTTTVVIPVEPGACYLVGAAAMGGDTRAVQVAARVGARLASDNGGSGIEAGVVSFCVGAEHTARLEIDAIGQRTTWVLGAWRVARAPLGSEVLP